eukprot:scaffold3357_cov268-Chaetoceros_neogracile.AAC.14
MPLQAKSLFTVERRKLSSRIRKLLSSNASQQKVEVPKTKIPIPTKDQLRAHYISNGLPMVGFGLMDQTGALTNINCFTSRHNNAVYPLLKETDSFHKHLELFLAALWHLTEENEFAFEVECHNDDPNATTFIVSGPDNDGLLAGMAAALTLYGCSILDVSAHKLPDGTIEDKFSVVDHATRRRLDDDELLIVSKLLLDASQEGPLMLKAQVNELENQNGELRGRIKHLEEYVVAKQNSEHSAFLDLSSAVHSALVHPFKPLAHACLLHLSLNLLLRVLKVPAVAELHHMSRLVYLALETAKGGFNGFTLSNIDLYGYSELSGDGC